MRRQDCGIWTRRLAALLFGGLWLATWPVTVVTWERDAAGYAIGMAPVAIPLHLVLPLLLGALIWLNASNAPGLLLQICALAGAIFGLVHLSILSVVDLLLLPEVASGGSVEEWVAGSIVGAVAYAGVCVVLCVIGGAASRALVHLLRRRAGTAG